MQVKKVLAIANNSSLMNLFGILEFTGCIAIAKHFVKDNWVEVNSDAAI